MLAESKEDKMIDLDERKNPLMTLRTVKYYCEKEGLFTTPELNDKLYLQYKGFIRIVPETLAHYNNLVALWLNNNGISKIEGLSNLIHLTSLALNNNSISRIEGLDNLYNLSILNLSHNKIELV
jgi:Leucine-rich repeat (LRR) protein